MERTKYFNLRAWNPQSYDSTSRSVEATLATEGKVEVFDISRMDFIEEVLLVNGANLPESGQVPLLDSHQRGSVRNVLGSVRNIKAKGQELVGAVFFADDNSGQSTEKKVRDGHLTDLSVGYQVTSYQYLEKDETKTIAGKQFTGPIRVVDGWELKEASLTPIGADEKAKTRGDNMNLDATKKTGGQANKGQDSQEDVYFDDQGNAINPVTGKRAYFDKDGEVRDLDQVSESERWVDVREAATHFGISDQYVFRMMEQGYSPEQGRKQVLEEVKNMSQPIGAGKLITQGRTDGEKRSEAMIDGLVMRSGYNLEKPAAGADQYRNVSIVDVARECLEASGESTRGMSATRVINKAMQTRMHTTSDFPAILENTGNKILREAYLMYPTTFQKWTVQGEGRDFKEMSRVQLSEAPDLKHVPEAAEYMQGTFGESKEVFSIQKYGRLFHLSWESLVNDDLKAFDRVAKAFVQAAKRGLNAEVYKELTENRPMADGKGIFHVDHYNLETDTALKGIVSPDRVSSARAGMRTQTGLQTDDPLNVEPRFLIVPAAQETDADILVNSQIGISGSDVPGAANPFYNKLEVVTEPMLDKTSTKEWYLSADPNVFDTVEVAYLDGEQVPYLEEETGFTTDSWAFKIRFCFGVKAIDYRGLFKNPGE